MIIKKQEPMHLREKIPPTWHVVTEKEVANKKISFQPNNHVDQLFENRFFILVGASLSPGVVSEDTAQYYRILIKCLIKFPDTNKYGIIAESPNLAHIIQDWSTLIDNVVPVLTKSPARAFEIDFLTAKYRRVKRRKSMHDNLVLAQAEKGTTLTPEQAKALSQAAEEERLAGMTKEGTMATVGVDTGNANDEPQKLDNVDTIMAKRLGNYHVSKLLGQGTFSKVKLAYHVKTNDKVAIKYISKNSGGSKDDDNQLEVIRREISILQGLHHRNVISIKEVLETQKHICIVQECAENGDLLDYINYYWCQTKQYQPKATRLFYETCEGLSYIHQMGIAHRDIKPTNILLSQDLVPKLSDFGLSKYNDSLVTACGSPIYAAPELMLHKEYDGAKADMWSIGVLFYNLITGAMPFGVAANQSVSQIYKAMVAKQLDFPAYAKADASAKDLCAKMLQVDPEKRISAQEVLSHPFLATCRKGYQEMMQAMQEHNRRISLRNVGDVSVNARTNLLVQEMLNNMDLSKWTFVRNERGLDIFDHNEINKNTNRACILTRTTFAVSAKQTYEYLRLHKGNPVEELNRGNKEVEVLDDNTCVIHSCHRARVYFSKANRDVVYLRHCRKQGDKYVVAMESVEHPRLTEKSGYVRLEMIPCGFIVEPISDNPNECFVTHSLMIDFKGNLDRKIYVMIINAYVNLLSTVKVAMYQSFQGGAHGNGGSANPTFTPG